MQAPCALTGSNFMLFHRRLIRAKTALKHPKWAPKRVNLRFLLGCSFDWLPENRWCPAPRSGKGTLEGPAPKSDATDEKPVSEIWNTQNGGPNWVIWRFLLGCSCDWLPENPWCPALMSGKGTLQDPAPKSGATDEKPVSEI